MRDTGRDRRTVVTVVSVEAVEGDEVPGSWLVYYAYSSFRLTDSRMHPESVCGERY